MAARKKKMVALHGKGGTAASFEEYMRPLVEAIARNSRRLRDTFEGLMHLARVEAYREAAEAAGLHQEVEEDLTELVQEAIASQGARRPAVHLGHLMGADWPTLFANLRQALDAGTVAPTLMVFQRR